jgi:flagellar basal body rod protein FlgG
MDAITVSVASGMRARMEALDLLANNISNSTTAGYKTDREFHNLYLSAEATGANLDGVGVPPAVLPVVERQYTDFSQGLLTDSGNPLHIALNGKGFLAVNAPSGILYTRNGNLRISSGGVLETSEGYAVRSVRGTPIRLDPSRPVEFSKDGTVRQDGSEAGRLQLSEFSDQQSLGKFGSTYFSWAPPSPAGGARAADFVPRPATNVEVIQGKLESSNVNPAESTVRLVSVMRQFEMLQRALTLAGEINRRAVEDVARVTT